MSAFAEDVRERRYPEPDHGYTMAPDEVRAARRPARRADRRAVHRRSQPLSGSAGELRFSTEGDGDVVDITAGVESVVASSGVEYGVVVACSCPGATAAVTAMEYEPGGVHDLRAALERLVPREGDYEHNRLNADTNSHAHIRAAIVGPSETLPVARRAARTGHLAAAGAAWISTIGPRQRVVLVHVLG